MGDEVLIKFRYFLILAIFVSLANSDTASDELFKKVAVQREGLKKEQLDTLKSPFVETKQTQYARDSKGDNTDNSFVVRAIIQDRVKVNEKWYSVGDNIYGLVIEKILNNGVLVKNNDGQEEIKLIVRENTNVSISK